MTRAATRVRRDLGATYRLFAHFRMDDSIFTHISARLPGAVPRFLLNPYGLRFEEVTPGELVTLDLDGNVLDDPSGRGINPAGFTIHSAVHAAREDAACVIHTHTEAGVAVSCLRDGLRPLNQWSLQFYNRIAYHNYESIALDLDERGRIQADLAHYQAMILRSHGLLVCGRSVAEAFKLMYNLERACRTQVAIMASGGETLEVPPGVAEKTARQYREFYDAIERDGEDDAEWHAYLRLLDRVAPGWDGAGGAPPD